MIIATIWNTLIKVKFEKFKDFYIWEKNEKFSKIKHLEQSPSSARNLVSAVEMLGRWPS